MPITFLAQLTDSVVLAYLIPSRSVFNLEAFCDLLSKLTVYMIEGFRIAIDIGQRQMELSSTQAVLMQPKSTNNLINKKRRPNGRGAHYLIL
jgi:hypothetical protein